jgi:ubiquinone/menaquinone biosynthesis C-methylase UbiE
VTRDLLHQEDVRTLVRDAYRAVAPSRGAVAEAVYRPDELAHVPAVARDHALGVASPVRHAALRPGETVLDLGCGGGLDTVLAGLAVGRAGRVHALDFLPEMLERTQAAAEAAGLVNVEPVEATMEAIPLPDEAVDVVISNGAVNLSPRKARVFAECARVLRPGGRLCVADLTVREEELPPEILTHPAAWAG